jgi:lipopolysaccharide/colanic/teichoic acid biosynthesis glycosyltransferase
MSVDDVPQVKLWSLKRAFDIVVSATALLLLSPLLLLIALMVKLESRGPIFYISKRAGSGYKIFDFYKFRSMRVGADAELHKLSHLNQYSGNGTASNGVFFKIKNDPRITRFGQFIRSTSLDEIPQLFNVLIGDMSLVGNRPLPLYEAEKLTKDQIAWRFLAPAGITGLWQITKRGKDDMSEEERIALDMEYAMKNSLVLDIKIMLKTIPALLQKEKV